MNGFYRTALGAVLLLLCSLTTVGQELEQITDVSLPGWRANTDIMDYEEHDGTVYVLRSSPVYEGKVFATLDPETGALTDLPYAGTVGLVGSSRYNSSHLTSLEGMLFAQVGADFRNSSVLFRIDGQSVTPLLPNGVHITSQLVSLRGEIYFMALTDHTMDEDIYSRTILRRAHLYRTDGTPGGTVRVAELPGYAWNAWLLAGKTALLVGMDSQTEAGARLHQYRPGEGLIGVGDRTFFQGFGGQYGWHKFYQSTPTMPSVYADGYFYFIEPYSHQLSRVAEYSPSVTPIADPSGVLSSLPWNTATYLAATDNGVYLSAYDNQTSSFSLFQVAKNTRIDFGTLRTGTAPYEANLVAQDGLLYFVEYINGTAGLLQYDPDAPLAASVLFYIDGWDFEYRLHATDDHLFVMPIFGNGNRLYRYTFADGSIQSVATGVEGVAYTLTDRGLLFNGRYTEGQFSSYQPHYLPHDATLTTPFLLGSSAGLLRRGVSQLRGTPGDRVVYSYQNSSLEQEYYQYDTGSERATPVPVYVPGLTTESARAVFLHSGQLLVTDVTDGATNFYVFVDGELTPLLRAGTQTPLRIEDGTGRISYAHQLYWQEFNSGNLSLHQFTIVGDQATDDVIATDLEGYWYWQNFGKLTIHYWEDEDQRNVERLLMIDNTTGEVLSDRRLGAGHFRSFAGNQNGVWLDHYDGSFSLRFYPSQEGSYTQAILGDELITAGRQYAYAVAGGLLFSIPDPDGLNWWMADANTGELTEVPGIAMSAEHGWRYPYAYATGSVVYYASTDGSRKTSLWRTDGTTDGTYQVADINPAVGLSQATVAGDSILYFAADGPDGVELYSLSLSGREKVRQVADVNPGTGDSDPGSVVPVEDGLFFLAAAGNDAPHQVYFIKSITTATREAVPAVQLSLFPNPTTELATLSVGGQHRLQSVSVIDNSGRRLLDQAARGQQAELDLSRLPVGTYHVVSRFEDGQRGYGKLSVVR